MNCRLPQKIGTPSGGGGVALPDGAFVPVTKFTDGRTYALVAKINGTYRYINTTTYNNYTMNATVVEVEEKSGYVLFGSEPATYKATASGDGFTLGDGTNFLHGTTSSGTALRYGTTSAVWKVDTSETGGFDSGKYLPKEVSSSVWLKNTSGGYDWCIKFESAGSFGYDRAGRDNTYSTGFVSFVLYEKYEGQTSGGDSGGSTPSGTVTLTVTHDGTAAGTTGGYVIAYTPDKTTVDKGTTIEIAVGSEVQVYAGGYDSDMAYVTFNGTQVAKGNAQMPYKFTITSNTTISYTYKSTYGIAAITTEGGSGGGSSGGGTTTKEYAVNITGTGDSTYCYATVNNTKYTSAKTLAVAAGTQISCYVKTQSGTAGNVWVGINLNGSWVLETTGTYKHTVNANCTVELRHTTPTDHIYITTE